MRINKRVRKPLYEDSDNNQSSVAESALLAIESLGDEKLHIHFNNALIFPSPINPRRQSLDQAGVTADAIKGLAIKEGEPVDEWQGRCIAFIEDLDSDSKKVWGELFDLSVSILRQGLLQPIVVNKAHIIVAGERRWTASKLASKKTSRVIVRSFTEIEEAVFRLAENLRRSDLSVAETVSGLRSVVRLSLGDCEPENNAITINSISDLTGAGRTTAAYYRAFCLLPDGDLLLKKIIAGKYTSIKDAYTDAAARVKAIRKGHELPTLPVKEVTTEVGSPAEKKSNCSNGSSATNIKVHIRPAVSRLIDTFSKIDGMPENVSSKMVELSKQWPEASEKEKSNILTDALNLAIEFLGDQE